MEVAKFIDILEKKQRGGVRKINVEIIEGKKKPIGEHKDWSIDKILDNRGSWSDIGSKIYKMLLY